MKAVQRAIRAFVRGRSKKTLAVVMGAVMLTLFGAGAALAHYAYSEAWVWYSSDSKWCTQAHSQVELDDADPNNSKWIAYSFIHLREDSGIVGGNCDAPLATSAAQPAGSFRVHPQLWYNPGGTAKWGICKNTKIRYNTSSATGFSVTKTWDAAVIIGAVCGSGYYGNLSMQQYKFSGTWRPQSNSKWMWSGCHASFNHNSYAC